jgi:AcrR family transcriptional regulator
LRRRPSSTHGTCEIPSHEGQALPSLPAGRADDIREAALSLFADRGYHGTSMKDLAEHLGIRAPSIYNHVESKQQILSEVMLRTMRTLLADHADALASTDDPVDQLRRATEAHVRYHARFPREVRIGNTELRAVEGPARDEVLAMRREYSRSWEALLERGVRAGRFDVPSPRLTAYGILEMGIGVALWFRPDGPMSEAVVAYHYADMALRLVGVSSADGPADFPVTARPARRGSGGGAGVRAG